MGMTAAQYRVALQALLPQGRAWPRDVHATLTMLLDAISDELARIDARCDDLVAEADPSATWEMLADWERVAGLPDPLFGSPSTVEGRREALMGKLTARGGQSRAFYIALAAALGYDIDIEEWIGGAPHVWSITCSTHADYVFRAGDSCAGDYLLWWEADSAFESWLNYYKPAHTRLVFNYASYLLTQDDQIVKGPDDVKILLQEQE